MAKGTSKSSAGATITLTFKNQPQPPQPQPQSLQDEDENEDDFPEAFEDGRDFQASGDVNHYSRSVTSSLQRKWDGFANQFQNGVTRSDDDKMYKDWESSSGKLFGYFRTTNSFEINKALYDPKNAGKTDAQIFTRTDRHGTKRDLQTVQTLDKAISNNKTIADASYTRFCSPNALKSTFGLSDAQIKMISNAGSLNAQQLSSLNGMLKGYTSYSEAYTSTSANRSMNAFGNPRNTQSRGFTIERRLNVPKGTNAYAPTQNAQESEVLFGRRMETQLTGITVGKDGHIVIHEKFVKYR